MRRGRWQRVATITALVCVAAQLCAVAALPAPPTVSGARTFSDIATPPPITEEELHNMVEHLLMEAYGDEYEPPSPRPKKENNQETTTTRLASSTTSSFGLNQQDNTMDNGITKSLLLLQQQQKMEEIQEQRKKLHQMQKQLQEEEQQQQEKRMVQLTNRPPITKGSLILHQQLKQSQRNVQSSAPALEKPKILLGQNTNSPNPVTTTQPLITLQPPVTARTRPRGIPTPEELQKALVFQQENQPGILIVDRRKKSKTEKK